MSDLATVSLETHLETGTLTKVWPLETFLLALRPADQSFFGTVPIASTTMFLANQGVFRIRSNTIKLISSSPIAKQ